eukprot:TRINITY_DN2212_c0_g1_i12.p1 TRINITY_DN2212_c0_g1~~TRINITY_DN2212_c0_g1_i12.p1  ORF type:complete len:308 (-),score=51.43 TRINITY_DN2212_c0_g1_i12:176-1078(-)
MIRRPPRSTLDRSSAASDVYKRQSLNTSKRYGFIHYMEPESANRLMEEQSMLQGQFPGLIVQEYRRSTHPQLQFNNIYVKNLPPTVTTGAALKELFAAYGRITSIGIKRNTLGRRPSYFGFVCFDNAEDAMRAVRAMNGKNVYGHNLYVCKSLSKDQLAREKRSRILQSKIEWMLRCVFVKLRNRNALDEEIVRQQFLNYAVKKVCIFRGGGRKAGAVEFENRELANKVITDYSGPLIVKRMELKNHKSTVSRIIRHGERMYYPLYIVDQKNSVEPVEPRECEGQCNSLQEERTTQRTQH